MRVDERGRILLPKRVREAAGIERGSYVRVVVEEGRVIVERLGSVAENNFGRFRVRRWPEDLDEFLASAVRGWWRSGDT